MDLEPHKIERTMRDLKFVIAQGDHIIIVIQEKRDSKRFVQQKMYVLSGGFINTILLVKSHSNPIRGLTFILREY